MKKETGKNYILKNSKVRDTAERWTSRGMIAGIGGVIVDGTFHPVKKDSERVMTGRKKRRVEEEKSYLEVYQRTKDLLELIEEI